jgi:hypothetical protein
MIDRALLLACASTAALALPPSPVHADVLLSEVLYDATGADDGLEWIELWNDGDLPVALGGWSLGWGGADYTSGTLALEGVIEPGAAFVVGGPLAGPENASPSLDLPVDLSPDLQNSGATADGVALFDVPPEAVGPDSIPVSAVIYGETNASGLLDETGAVGAVDVADAPGGSSIERGLDGVWRIQAVPTPGVPPEPVPEPAAAALALSGAGALALLGRR